MNKNIYYILIVIFVVISNVTYAQNRVAGYVFDKKTNKNLSGAVIYNLEQNKQVQTDSTGYYVFTNLPRGNVKIQFSYVGYKTVIRVVNMAESKAVLNVPMESTSFQLDEVVVSGGTFSTQHENTIKIDCINNKDIASTGSPSFIKSLTQIPGVDMIAKGNGVAQPVIRGLSMTNILMLNNGIKLENFQFSENHPYLIDEFGVDRVEVIKGPASLLYGSDAVGGVINVIKEKPAIDGKIEGDYNAQYHSNTEGLVTNLGIKSRSGDFFYGLRAGIRSHQDYKDGNMDRVPNTRYNENSFKVNLGLNRSFGVFRLFYDYNRPKLGMCVGDAIKDVTENGRKNKYWYQDLTNHIISTKNTLFLGKYKFDMNASYQMNNRKLQTDNHTPAFDMVDMDMNTFSYEIKTYLPSSANSEYILGIQGANKTNRNHNAPNHVIPDANVDDFSFFGLAQKTFFTKLNTQAGLRYDYRYISTIGETNKEAISSNFGNVSLSLGATYEFNENFLLRTNLASAYRTPNIAELTENGMHGDRYEEGNPSLKSQRNYEADLSTHFHSGNLMIDVTGFYNRINNYIYISPTGESTSSGNKIYRYSQTDSKIYGGEFLVEYLPEKWIDLKASYSYIIGKEDNGDYLPFIPQNKIHLDVNFKKDKILCMYHPFFRIGGLYADKQTHPAMFETESGGYFLLNAGIGVDFKWFDQFVSLLVQADNLLNKKYIDHLSTLKDLGYNNMGRNICFSIKIPFAFKK